MPWVGPRDASAEPTEKQPSAGSGSRNAFTQVISTLLYMRVIRIARKSALWAPRRGMPEKQFRFIASSAAGPDPSASGTSTGRIDPPPSPEAGRSLCQLYLAYMSLMVSSGAADQPATAPRSNSPHPGPAEKADETGQMLATVKLPYYTNNLTLGVRL